MQRAIDGDDVALPEHLFETIHTSTSNLFLHLRFEGLVVKVKQLLAVEWLKSSEDTLTNPANSNRTNNFAFQVIFVLCCCCHIPISGLDLLVCRNEVSNEEEDGHDDVLSNRNDIGTCDFGDGDAAIDLICSVQVDMV
jgi:hypothetical protein